MSGEEIRITITPDGMTFDASNFAGKSCLKEYQNFVDYMAKLGITCKEVSQEMKQESYIEETQEDTVSNGY